MEPQTMQNLMQNVMGGASGIIHALTGILVPLGLFALIPLIVWLKTRANQDKLQAKSDLHRQLIEKFSSGQELSEFLSVEENRRFLEDLWSERIDARQRVLQTIRKGAFLLVLGLGASVLMVWQPNFVYPAVLILALGIGFLVAAAISYRLSKKWGLIPEWTAASRDKPPSVEL